MRSRQILAFAVLVAGSTTGQAQGQEQWAISAAAVFPGGAPANPDIAEVLRRLESPAGEGAPVSAEEFLAYCDQAGPLVDRKALFRYAVPGSKRNQDREHAEFVRSLMQAEQVQAGTDFLQEHDALLRAAEARYEVAPQDIVAILMWESGLGRHVGRHRVFDVLLGQLLYLEPAMRVAREEQRAIDGPGTLEATTPKEQAHRIQKLTRRAVTNLVALVRLAKAKGQDPTLMLGSWAGAIGYPQFMPASFRHAADGDGDGVIDLNHWPDAVFSVASYLQANGYGPSAAARRRGIFRYNPIDSYADGVLRYANAIRERATRASDAPDRPGASGAD